MIKNRYFISLFLAFVLLNINFSLKQEYDFFRAAYLYKKGKLLKSLKIYSIYKKQLSKESEYLYNIGTVYLKMGEYKIALKYFGEALKQSHNSELDFRLLFNIGILFYETGDLNNAVSFFKKSAIIKPDNLILKKNLELILRNMKNNKKTRKELKTQDNTKKDMITEPILNYINETEKEAIKSFLKKKGSKKEEKYW